MNRIRESVRKVALDVVGQVNGEGVETMTAGISFELPMCVEGHDVAVRFMCFISDLEFEVLGVFRRNGTELKEYRNDPSVEQTLRRLNSLFDIGLKRAGIRDRELLKGNL